MPTTPYGGRYVKSKLDLLHLVIFKAYANVCLCINVYIHIKKKKKKNDKYVLYILYVHLRCIYFFVYTFFTNLFIVLF